MAGTIDFAEFSYPVVREAFNATLNLCMTKLTKAELRLAEECLDADRLDSDPRG